ncbi:MAG: hypothetical protein WD361_14970 [Gracilimonas sp.]
MSNTSKNITPRQYLDGIESGIELMDQLAENEPDKAVQLGKMMISSLDEQISKFTPEQIAQAMKSKN